MLSASCNHLPPAFQAAVEKGNFLTKWDERLALVKSCDQLLDSHDRARHEGYRAALEQCIEDAELLLGRDVKAPELPTPPSCWRNAGAAPYNNGDIWVRRWNGQTVKAILTLSVKPDGQKWAHLSASRPDRCLTWEEMCEVKRDFLGDLGAIQLVPPRAEHVNLHSYCLHWWAPLDRWPLPDFTLGGAVI